MAVAPAHVEALQRLGAEVVDPFADGLVPAHATQRRGGGERQHRGQRMAPALAAAGVVDAVEERGQGTHLGGAEHHLRGSMAQVRIEMHRTQPGPCGARQRVDEHPLRARVFAVAVAPALAAKAAGTSDLDPVRGSVDGAVETRRVDEGLHKDHTAIQEGSPPPDSLEPITICRPRHPYNGAPITVIGLRNTGIRGQKVKVRLPDGTICWLPLSCRLSRRRGMRAELSAASR